MHATLGYRSPCDYDRMTLLSQPGVRRIETTPTGAGDPVSVAEKPKAGGGKTPGFE
jgi:hypothetical protein